MTINSIRMMTTPVTTLVCQRPYQLTQLLAVVKIKGEWETAHKLSNGTTINDLPLVTSKPDFKVTILFNVK